jgi:hypothetical protein
MINSKMLKRLYPKIETKDKLIWFHRANFKFLIKPLTYGLGIGLLIVLYILNRDIIQSEVVRIGLEGVPKNTIILLKNYHWLKLVVVMMVGLSLGLLVGMNKMLNDGSLSFIQIKKPFQRFYGSLRQLHFSILQHWHLRYLLYKTGALPLNLVHFLNEMKDRNILESDGATWRFRHRMIQDYFAELWAKETTRQ